MTPWCRRGQNGARPHQNLHAQLWLQRLRKHRGESEGGFWDNQYNDDVSIAPEGAQLIPPDDVDREPLVGSPVGRNIGLEREAVRPVSNLVPAPIQAPEGAYQRRRGKAKQYPPAVWRRGADGKLERIAMNIVRKEYKKFNRDMFALTFGHHDIPPMAQQMSKKRQRLNYKQ